jgi:TetR/AcrR family transcriptional regulator, transcriptional repressor for nem operon
MTTQDRILSTGRSLIMSRGFNGFSYADVSEAVGIRKASIHHYFPTKTDLAEAVLAQSRDQIRDQAEVMAREGIDPVSQLRFYAAYWERCITEGTEPFCVAGMLATELPTLSPELAQAVQAHFQELKAWLSGVLDQGAALGRFRLQGSADHEAESFMSLVYGAMLTARALAAPQMFKTIVEGALDRLIVAQ